MHKRKAPTIKRNIEILSQEQKIRQIMQQQGFVDLNDPRLKSQQQKQPFILQEYSSPKIRKHFIYYFNPHILFVPY